MSYLETIEAQYGRRPEDIDAVPILSTWYGPSSLVCNMVRPLDEKTFEAFFVVGQNICGPTARPPMFNRLTFQNDKFTTETDEDDAKEHLVIDAGKGVVPGHNLAGLLAEAQKLAFNQGKSNPREYMVRSYDFIQFKGLVLPNQELVITGSTTLILTNESQTRAKARNIHLEPVDLSEEEIQTMLAQHWFPEITAQALGITKAHLLKEKMIPIFLEVGKSSFETIPVHAGDIVRTHLSLFDSEDNQAFANSQTFIGDQLVAQQEEVLLEFFPLEEVFGTTKPN